MITLYGGRLILERRKLSENWRAIINIPGLDQHTIDLCTPDLREAFIRGQYHYIALRNRQPVEEIIEIYHHKAKCWSCVQWLPRLNECSFGFPEARQTGGRFAARCALYDDGKKGSGTDGAGRGLLD